MMYAPVGDETMPTKVRKQVYIELRQQRLLKRLADKMGVAESEIIRQALDLHMRELQRADQRAQAWQEERAFIQEWMKQGRVPGGRKWKRADLYER